MSGAEERWAERDQRRAETEAYYDQKREDEFQRYVAVVKPALDQFTQGHGLNVEASRAAIVAVQALMDAGYVFVTMGPSDA